MKLNIEGHIALVCGGSSGIGKAAALALAADGAIPILLSRSQERLAAAAQEIEHRTGIRPALIVGDVADPTLPQRAVGEALERHGRLDILINNSGGPPPGSFLEHDDERWLGAIQANLLSVVRFTRAVALPMKERGYGRVVNVTTFLAKEPTPRMVLSGTLRAGVSAFAKAISSELVPHGITVNTVGPSAVLTERARTLSAEQAEAEGISLEEALKRAAAALPIQRLADPAELGDVIAFLCSPRASYLTGISLLVDGGLSRGVF
jgi:3-oxoacyl-[acyl-carrier protein] reductase